MRFLPFSRLDRGAAVAALLVLAVPFRTVAEPLEGKDLVDALRHGGYVLVMRHARSPMERPDKSAADPDNPKQERQLDQAGRAAAQAMGEAIRALRVPIGPVLASPTYRAQQTARLVAGGTTPIAVPELGEGAGMMAGPDPARAAWLKDKATELPPAGADTLIVTHVPNIEGAFPDAFARKGAQIAAGEALVFQPDGKGAAPLVGRIKIEEWPKLAERR